MKAAFAEATGSDLPQIVLVPENDAERLLLKWFVGGHARGCSFVIHSYGFTSGHPGVTSMNFGWRHPPLEPEKVQE